MILLLLKKWSTYAVRIDLQRSGKDLNQISSTNHVSLSPNPTILTFFLLMTTGLIDFTDKSPDIEKEYSRLLSLVPLEIGFSSRWNLRQHIMPECMNAYLGRQRIAHSHRDIRCPTLLPLCRLSTREVPGAIVTLYLDCITETEQVKRDSGQSKKLETEYSVLRSPGGTCSLRMRAEFCRPTKNNE